MPHRDPKTGKFVSGDRDDFDRIEQLHAVDTLSVPAADLDGATGQNFGEESRYEGEELYDFEEVLDRDEVGVMLWQAQQIVVYGLSTSTADGTVRGAVELSFSPSESFQFNTGGTTDLDDQTGTGFAIESGEQFFSDTGDVIGRHLQAVGYSPFSDGATGVGGSGGAGIDSWEGPILVDPVVDDRDSLFHNGVIEAQNVADASVHMDLAVWTVLGAMED